MDYVQIACLVAAISIAIALIQHSSANRNGLLDSRFENLEKSENKAILGKVTENFTMAGKH